MKRINVKNKFIVFIGIAIHALITNNQYDLYSNLVYCKADLLPVNESLLYNFYSIQHYSHVSYYSIENIIIFLKMLTCDDRLINTVSKIMKEL